VTAPYVTTPPNELVFKDKIHTNIYTRSSNAERALTTTTTCQD
jgi:hypothetical protein